MGPQLKNATPPSGVHYTEDAFRASPQTLPHLQRLPCRRDICQCEWPVLMLVATRNDQDVAIHQIELVQQEHVRLAEVHHPEIRIVWQERIPLLVSQTIALQGDIALPRHRYLVVTLDLRLRASEIRTTKCPLLTGSSRRCTFVGVFITAPRCSARR